MGTLEVRIGYTDDVPVQKGILLDRSFEISRPFKVARVEDSLLNGDLSTVIEHLRAVLAVVITAVRRPQSSPKSLSLRPRMSPRYLDFYPTSNPRSLIVCLLRGLGHLVPAQTRCRHTTLYE